MRFSLRLDYSLISAMEFLGAFAFVDFASEISVLRNNEENNSALSAIFFPGSEKEKSKNVLEVGLAWLVRTRKILKLRCSIFG